MVHAKKTRFISFRISEEQLIEIGMAAVVARVKPANGVATSCWQSLDLMMCSSQTSVFLFQNLVRVQYFVTHRFQLLADHNLTSEEWKKATSECERPSFRNRLCGA
jgi:hypothetical protein